MNRCQHGRITSRKKERWDLLAGIASHGFRNGCYFDDTLSLQNYWLHNNGNRDGAEEALSIIIVWLQVMFRYRCSYRSSPEYMAFSFYLADSQSLNLRSMYYPSFLICKSPWSTHMHELSARMAIRTLPSFLTSQQG